MRNKTITLMLAVMMAGLSSGCATVAQLNEVRDIARQAQADAAQASNTVESATRAADQASSKADRALQAAEDAKACCQRNSDKIDRMFEKSMQK